MLKHLYLMLIATFILGFTAGGLLYLNIHTGEEGTGGLPEPAGGFSVTAYMDGGCAMLSTCPSYRIEGNVTYRYITRGSVTGEGRYEDELTEKQLATLKDLLASTDFARVKNSKFTGACPIAYDGASYQYDVTFRGETFMFDSCTEALGNVPLFSALERYFVIFDAAHKLAE